jgi:hypothetical protein
MGKEWRRSTEGRRDGGTEGQRDRWARVAEVYRGTEGRRDGGTGGQREERDTGEGQQDRPHVNICKENINLALFR